MADLPEELLGRAAEAMWAAWYDLADLESAVTALAVRAHEIEGPLEYADVADGLVAAAASSDAIPPALVVANALAAELAPAEIERRPLHAGHAARAAADLASIETAARHPALATLAGVTAVPHAASAPLARAIGRFLDLDDERWLRTLLRDVLLPIPAAAADAAIELAHGELCDAFTATDGATATRALETAAALFDEAVRADEGRADATAFAAATRCALAFVAGDKEAMRASYDEINRSRVRLAAWSQATMAHPEPTSRPAHGRCWLPICSPSRTISTRPTRSGFSTRSR